MTSLGSRTVVPFRGSLAVARGEVTWARLRRHEFVKLRYDTYVGADVEVDVGVRLRGLATWAGPGAVVAGPSAALGWGVPCPWDGDEVVLPTSRRLAPDRALVRRDRLWPDEVTWRWQVRTTTPERTAFDLATRGDLPDAVAAVDALARAWRFDAAELGALVVDHPGVRGLVRVREVVELMDPLAESLPETRTRVGLVLRGVPRPVSQHPVVLPNGRTVRLDLAWPRPRPGMRPVGLEYDGEVHRSAAAHGKDLDRHAALDDLGWDIVHVTGRQLADLDTLARRLRRKLGF